jgi:hypothetical protein
MRKREHQKYNHIKKTNKITCKEFEDIYQELKEYKVLANLFGEKTVKKLEKKERNKLNKIKIK